MVPLELTEAAADPAVLRDELAEAVPGRVIHRDVGGEVAVVTRLRDAVAELLVAAGDEPVVEQPDVRKHLAADDETARGGEALLLEIPLDGKARVVVVAGGERGILGEREFDVTAHVVGVCGLERRERRVEPVLGDGHVGVDEREDFAVGVADAGVAGGVGGLNLAFVDEGEVVVIVLVGADDFRGAVGGAVVDDDDPVCSVRGLVKYRIEC